MLGQIMSPRLLSHQECTLHGGLSHFRGTRPLVPTPFYRNARPHFPSRCFSCFHTVTQQKDTVSSRHRLGIQLPISTPNHDSTEAGTPVCPSSPPVPGELLIPDGNSKSQTSQKHAKATTMSVLHVLPSSHYLPIHSSRDKVKVWEARVCDHLGMLKKDLSLQPIASSLLISLSGAL